MSIATAIQAAQAKVAAAYTECNAKGATMPSAADQDLAHLDDTIASIPTGGGITPAPSKDVNFYDYEGTILYSYTKAEFLALTAMPANPDRTSEGLTAQGWNWSLADAQAYVTKYRMIDIGQTYITTDGDTKLFITMATRGRMAVPLYIVQSDDEGVEIDWGDGSSSETITGTGNVTKTHTYQNPGDYVISLHIASGTLELSWNDTTTRIIGTSASVDDAYRQMLTKVFIGVGVKINRNALDGCICCRALMLGTHNAAKDNFATNSSLIHLTFAQGIETTAQEGIANAALHSIALSKTIRIGTQALYGTRALQRICLPLAQSLAQNSLRQSTALSEVFVPETYTVLATAAFTDSTSIGKLHMTSAVPPNIASNTFGGTPADMVIYVPYSSDHSILAAYQTANNWSNYASQMVEETEV